jgi:hypothetical protein
MQGSPETGCGSISDAPNNKEAMLKSITGAVALSVAVLSPAHAESPRPLKVLIVSGGCCHDYAKQRELLEMN